MIEVFLLFFLIQKLKPLAQLRPSTWRRRYQRPRGQVWHLATLFYGKISGFSTPVISKRMGNEKAAVGRILETAKERSALQCCVLARFDRVIVAMKPVAQLHRASNQSKVSENVEECEAIASLERGTSDSTNW